MIFVYGVFLLVIAGILVFSGKTGRRQLFLALACGGAITLILPFIYAGTGDAQVTLMQLLYFPLLVCVTWLVMFLISRFRAK